MYCPQCGKQTDQNDLFCGSCGKQLRAVFVPLRQTGSQQNTAPKPQPAPGPGTRAATSSFPRAGFTSAPRPEPKPAPATPKPEPKPAPAAPKPEPKTETAAVPKTQQLITTPQPGLPKDTCYDADGKLTWFYRDLEKDPTGNFVIKFVFEEDHIANYEGIDISSQSMADAQVSIRYYYKRVTIVERHAETGWIFFRHGIDRYFLKVSSEQIDFVLDEFMKRCPGSKMGVVKQW